MSISQNQTPIVSFELSGLDTARTLSDRIRKEGYIYYTDFRYTIQPLDTSIKGILFEVYNEALSKCIKELTIDCLI